MFYSLNIILRTLALRIVFFILATPEIFLNWTDVGIRKKTGGGGEDRLEGNQLLQCSGKWANKGRSQGNGSRGAEMGKDSAMLNVLKKGQVMWGS